MVYCAQADQPPDRKYDGRRPARRRDGSGLYTAAAGEGPRGGRRRSIAGHFTASLRRRLRTSARVRPGAFLLDATADDDTSAAATSVHLVVGRAPLPRDTPPPRVSHLKCKSLSRPSFCTSAPAAAFVSFLPTLMTHRTAFSLSPTLQGTGAFSSHKRAAPGTLKNHRKIAIPSCMHADQGLYIFDSVRKCV